MQKVNRYLCFALSGAVFVCGKGNGMSVRRICDLCGRNLYESDMELKVKVKKRHHGWECDMGWDRIDCHKECLVVLLDAARKKREEARENDGAEPYPIDRNGLLRDLNATLAYDAEISAVIMAQPRLRV